MNYLLMGLLLGIGWYLGRLIITWINELIEGILIGLTHKSKLLAYSMKIATEHFSQKESGNNPRNRIGF